STIDGDALGAILRESRDDVFLKYFQHGVPYSEEELKQAALQLLSEVAVQQGTALEQRVGHAAPYSARELKHTAGQLDVSPLALDQYIAYVRPEGDLGVATRIPGWILFLPLVMWLLWNVLCCLPFLPDDVRRLDGGFGLWLAGLGIAPAVAIV